MHDLIASNRIILSKNYCSGQVFLIEIPGDMLAVLGYKHIEEEPIYSRAFFYNEENRKKVEKNARKHFNLIKEYFYQKKLHLLDEVE